MIQIFAINDKGNREEITDLYWFEENYVHNFEGRGLHANYIFEFFVCGQLIHTTAKPTGLIQL